MSEPRWRRYLRFWRASARADVEDEIEFHVEERTAELLAGGMSPENARRVARERLGDLPELREELVASARRRERRRGRIEGWRSLAQDARIAVRSFRREPLLVAGVLAALAIGIGANAAMFSMVDQLLLRPPAGVAAPERVERFYFTRPSWGSTSPVTNYPQFRRAAAAPGVQGAAAFWMTRASVGEGTGAWEAAVELVSSSFFPLLGARPALGRSFSPGEERPGFPEPGVMLAYETWESRFGGDPGVIGRRILVNGWRYPVIGIAPRGFTGVELLKVDLWLPLSATEHGLFIKDWATNDGSYWLQAVARLVPNARPDVIARDATTLFRAALADAHSPDSLATVALAPVTGVRDGDMKPTREVRVSLWLGGVSLAMLVIAAANVATLLLLRAMRRRREIAVRRALGMSTRRLGAQLMVESLVLAVTAGAATLVAMHWVGAALHALLLPGFVWTGWIGGRVAAVVFAAVALTGLATAAVPASALAQRELTDELRTGGNGVTWTRSRAHTALLFVQAALSVTLLVAAGLFVRSLQRARGLDYGFDLDRVLLVEPEYPRDGLDTARVGAVFREALGRLQRMRGIEAGSFAESEPFGWSFGARFDIPGRDHLPTVPTGGPYDSFVTPDYFRTLGIRLLRGRLFTDTDVRGSPAVMVINKAMADLYWPGRDPLGACVIDNEERPCTRIVGIIENTRQYGLGDETPRLLFYRPWAQMTEPARHQALFVRTARDGAAMQLAVQRTVQSIGPDVPFVRVETLGQRLDPQLRAWRLGATMLTAFGILAMALAAIGLYSVVAYGAAQRARELGIRVALGAQRSDIARAVALDGARVALLGLVAGLGLGLLLGRQFGDLLFQTSWHDGAAIGVAAGVLLVVAAAASAVPGIRASRPDLALVLRGD